MRCCSVPTLHLKRLLVLCAASMAIETLSSHLQELQLRAQQAETNSSIVSAELQSTHEKFRYLPVSPRRDVTSCLALGGEMLSPLIIGYILY